MKVRIAGVQESLRDSDGIAQVIYFQGCTIKCLGCSNPALQDHFAGEEIELETIIERLEETKDWMDAIVYQGGEPTEQEEALIEICKWAHKNKLKNWVYTGTLFGQMSDRIKEVADVIIDGPFMQSLSPALKDFRGSDNQTMYRKINGVWDKGDN